MKVNDNMNDSGQSSNPLGTVLWSFRREFLAVAVFSMVVNLLMLTPTLYMLQVYDRVMVSLNEMTLLIVSLITLFFFVMMAFAEWARSMMLVRTGVRLDGALSEQVFRASFLSYLKPTESDPARSFGYLITLRQFLTGQGIFAFFDSPWVPIYIGVLFLLHPWLGVMAVVFALVQSCIAWMGHRATRQGQLEANQAMSNAQRFMQSKLRNAEVIKAMGMLDGLLDHWRALQYRGLLEAGQAQSSSGRVTAASKWIRYAQQTFSLAVGAWLVIRGEISPGAMIAANVLTTRALAPIDSMVSAWPGFLSAREAYTRLRTLLGLPTVQRTRVLSAKPAGSVHVENLTVQVPGKQLPVLDKVSFALKPGTVTVVLGPSGSGKSTLARTLLGIWPEHEGRIQLDEQPIHLLSRESLGPMIGYLPQDIELFEGSIAENIARMGEVDSARVIAAAQAAGLHDMILRMPKGYDTLIGQMSGALSGGQRQRIGLARALYGDPVLLVLDEPNANLDDEGERALMRSVLAMKKRGAAIMLISHRPGIVKVADELLILREGQVVANGPRDEVVKQIQQGPVTG